MVEYEVQCASDFYLVPFLQLYKHIILTSILVVNYAYSSLWYMTDSITFFYHFHFDSDTDQCQYDNGYRYMYVALQ
jgi:hypothetical protein